MTRDIQSKPILGYVNTKIGPRGDQTLIGCHVIRFYYARLGRDGAVVRALAFHQCGPGSIPGPGVICGLSLLLVLVPAPRVFLRVLRFSSLHKNQHFQIKLIWQEIRSILFFWDQLLHTTIHPRPRGRDPSGLCQESRSLSAPNF